MNIAILGSNGLLGSMLIPFFKNKKEWNIFEFQTSSKINNLANPENIKSLLSAQQFDVVVNLTALANVETCESNPQAAYESNAAINLNLAHFFKETSTQLIHISTDHIYDKKEGSIEEDIVLNNIYAYSKLLGDTYLSKHKNHLIFRTNFFGKSNNAKKSFTDWLNDSAVQNNSISLFNDVYFNPVHYSTIFTFIELGIKNKYTGIFNLGSSTILNKAEFAEFFLKKTHSEYKNYKIGSIELNPHLIKRPRQMGMNCQKLEKEFNFKLPTLHEELDKVINEYR